MTDLASKWGTFVNGMKLSPHVETPLTEGDLIRVTPWTFSLSRVARRPGLISEDDVGRSTIQTITSGRPAPMPEDLLSLLLEASAAIHGADSEQQLAERVMDVAIRGTGLPNAAVLRPLDSQGRVEVIGSRIPENIEERFSRSLLTAAANGQVAQLSSAGGDISHSIVQMNVTAAICVPLMLGSAAAAFLYLDARTAHSNRVGSQSLRPNASAFAAALGQLASLALANLKRIEMERRHLWIDGELRAAAAAQQWILPPRETIAGPFSCIGQSRAGQYVGGDFFDVIDLGNGRLVVAVGDVAGKGIPASVLMTAAQGFLHAALRSLDDVGKAVTALNRFVAPRRPENRFVTLWVGLFDSVARELRYVDAGHGYALLVGQDFTPLDVGGGPPIGVTLDYEYVAEVLPLPASGKAIAVSDGIIEQFGQVILADGSTASEQCKMNGVRNSMQQTGDADDIARLFNSLIRHAGTDQLADDATAVVVCWGNQTG
jgi:serine phosphatase RsbU (regulator of sigma subunit)